MLLSRSCSPPTGPGRAHVAFLGLRADHTSAHSLALGLAVETDPFRAGMPYFVCSLLQVQQSKRRAERTTAALWRAIPKGQMRTAWCAAFAAIAAALRTTHRRALLLSPASLYPLAARAEPLPAGRKELYALVCAAAWVLDRAAGGR